MKEDKGNRRDEKGEDEVSNGRWHSAEATDYPIEILLSLVEISVNFSVVVVVQSCIRPCIPQIDEFRPHLGSYALTLIISSYFPSGYFSSREPFGIVYAMQSCFSALNSFLMLAV